MWWRAISSNVRGVGSKTHSMYAPGGPTGPRLRFTLTGTLAGTATAAR
jgi:hypothetical protein